jgi:GH25 family lysozyme M1 (1,4-beta-N-acetylmuramidase)
MNLTILTLALSGILAGLVNYIIIVKKLQLPNSTGTFALTALVFNPPVKKSVRFFRAVIAYLQKHWELVGYMIVGIAGASVVPLFNALFGPIKVDPPSGSSGALNLTVDSKGLLVLFGYGLIFGMFANTIFKDILGVLRGQMSQMQKDLNTLKTTAPGGKGAPAAGDKPAPIATRALLASGGSGPASYNDLVHTAGSLSLNFVKGVDVSHFQSAVDWAALVQAGVRFVYIKASDGLNGPDKLASAHASTAQQYQLKIGYYHFGRPFLLAGGNASQDAQDQVNKVKTIVAGLPKADLPFVLDLEDDPGNGWDTNLSQADYQLWVQTFLSAFATGTPMAPIIYSRKTYLDEHLPAGHALGNQYKCWLARYSADYLDAVPPVGWAQWYIWQFTSRGVIGDNTNLDLDIWWREDFNQY